MKTTRISRLTVVLLLAGMSLHAMAEGAVRVNKALRLQKIGGKSVLRSADSRLPQNIAYFDREVNVSAMPQELKDFLSSYEEAMNRVADGEELSSVLSVSRNIVSTADTVGPILGGIMFDQGTPYNDRCPFVGGGRAVTGCVATAMSQIMTFYKYPAVGVGTATYTGTNGESTYNYADHPFDWTNILDTYKNGEYTAAQGAAVAELCLAAGASVNMNYNAAASGANSDRVAPALRDIFGYDSSIGYLHDATDDIIASVWVLRLKKEFDAGRPVYYAGSTQTSGHAFLMDGYTVTGDNVYFHLNWGWNGSYNGWFLITRLRPVDENYSSYSNDMVYNIFPPGTGIGNVSDEVTTKVDMNQPVYTILGTKIPASSMQRGNIYIQKGRKFVW